MVQTREKLAERKRRLLCETLFSLHRHLETTNIKDVDVVVFGSFASGQFDALSDVDLAVIAPTDEDIADAQDLAAHLLRWRPPHAQGVDVVVLSRACLPRSGLANAIAAGIPVRVGIHQGESHTAGDSGPGEDACGNRPQSSPLLWRPFQGVDLVTPSR